MSEKMKLLIAEGNGFSPQALGTLKRTFEVDVRDLDRVGLLAEVAGYDVLWVKLRTRIDAEIMARAPRLRTIATNTTGLTHIDLDEAERRGIRVVSLRGEVDFLNEIRATAEHTIGLILALLRKIPAAHRHVVEGGWNRDLFAGRELHRKTAGIVGYGRLGKIVARYLRAFDMRVLATSPGLTEHDCEPGVEAVPLDVLLAGSDIVSLHADMRPENRNMFGSAEFAAIKPGAVFINTARGELVDEAALLDALESGHLVGAALDVLAEETTAGMGDRPLVRYARTHDNLLLTPHLGGNTPESLEKTERFLADKLVALARVQ